MRTLLPVLVSLGAFASTAHAQRLKSPQASPAAELEQTIGLTEIKVSYHRPAINGRTVWGGLVPWGEVWRAGANENTTVTFSSDVKVEGKALKAGTYGLHMIPTQASWTIIFSNMNVAWGSFTYDQKEDALRVTVKPRTVATSEERLSYHFDDPTDKKATLVLAWEKLAVPVAIEVDTPKVVMASMRAELRGTSGFTPEGWNEAAQYWVQNGGPLDEAVKMVDRSVQMRAMFGNLMTRAAILDKQGKANDAKESRTKALAIATEADLNLYGYRLMGEKKMDEALAMFKTIVDKYPESWNARDSLGEALANKGDKPGAIAAYEKALSMVKDAAQKKRIEGVLKGLKAP
jgi:tetratricopeptide (TPR) repeat protein